MGISTSLYNGAYIDDYKYTKRLITNAYRNNAVQMEVFNISATPTRTELLGLTSRLRELYLNFLTPSTKYNAWAKVGGYGRSIVSWSKPENIVVFVSNKMASILDVNVLARAFNIDKAELVGRVYYVEDFDIIDDNGVVVYDGSNILAMICDRRWFKIREKDMFMDEFYNANNRSWQSYLNVIKSFNYSLFANAFMLVKAIPEINISSMAFVDTSITIPEVGNEVIVTLNTTPFTATQEVTFTNGKNNTIFTINKIDDRHVKLTGAGEGTDTLTATAGSVTATIEVTVPSQA